MKVHFENRKGNGELALIIKDFWWNGYSQHYLVFDYQKFKFHYDKLKF